MSKRTLILAALVTALVAPTLVFAQPFGGPGRGGHGAGFHACGAGVGPGGGHGLRMLDRMAVLLDLTDAQEAQLEAIKESTREQVEPIAERLRAERDAWRAAHEPGTFDEEAFRTHFESQSAQRLEIAVLTAEAFERAWQVLTPEQQTQLESWRAKMEERRASRGGRFGGPPVD
jgi:Spy/CpxP family protein refolding chaperone